MTVYRVRFRGHTGIIPAWTFGLHVQSTGGRAAEISDQAVLAFTDMWDGVPAGTDDLKTLYDVATLVDDVQVDELDSENRFNVAQAIATINRAGTAVTQPLPPNVAVVCSQVTTLPTRRGRGRSALPPPTEANTDTGELLAGSRDVYAAAYKNLLDNLNAAGFTVVVLHQPGDTITPAPSTVVAIRVGNVFDTQQRRRRKIKEVYTQLALA